MIRCLIEQGYLLISPDKYPVLRISKKIWELQDTSIRVLLRKAREPEADSGSRRMKPSDLPQAALPEGFTQEQGEELFSLASVPAEKVGRKGHGPSLCDFRRPDPAGYVQGIAPEPRGVPDRTGCGTGQG